MLDVKKSDALDLLNLIECRLLENEGLYDEVQISYGINEVLRIDVENISNIEVSGMLSETFIIKTEKQMCFIPFNKITAVELLQKR